MRLRAGWTGEVKTVVYPRLRPPTIPLGYLHFRVFQRQTRHDLRDKGLGSHLTSAGVVTAIRAQNADASGIAGHLNLPRTSAAGDVKSDG